MREIKGNHHQLVDLDCLIRLKWWKDKKKEWERESGSSVFSKNREQTRSPYARIHCFVNEICWHFVLLAFNRLQFHCGHFVCLFLRFSVCVCVHYFGRSRFAHAWFGFASDTSSVNGSPSIHLDLMIICAGEFFTLFSFAGFSIRFSVLQKIQLDLPNS